MLKNISLSYAYALRTAECAAGPTTAQLEGFLRSRRRLTGSIQEKIGKKEVEFINHIRRDIRGASWKKIADAARKVSDGMLVIGMGGSSLGTKALYEALSPFQQRVTRELFFLDNVDPERIHLFMDRAHMDRLAVNVVTKSGETLETIANFLIVLDRMKRERGRSFSSTIFITTASNHGDLISFAHAKNIRIIPLENNDSGRYSVLGPTGLFPLYYSGINTDMLLSGARKMLRRCLVFDDCSGNPALLHASLKRLLSRTGIGSEVIFSYSSLLRAFIDWYVQLLAESTGKKYDLRGRTVHEGQTPLGAVGASDQHSLLQLFLEGPKDKTVSFWEVEEFRKDFKVPEEEHFTKDFHYICGKKLGDILRAEKIGTEFALVKAGVPCVSVRIPRIDEYCLGQFIALMEMQVFFSCAIALIDPFNQPGVELGKKVSKEILAGTETSGKIFELNNFMRRRERYTL